MDAYQYLRRICPTLLGLALRLYHAEAGQATAGVLLVTLAGSSILATATFESGTDVFAGFEDLFHAAVSRTSGALEVRGSIVATAAGKPLKIDTIQMTLGAFGNGAFVALNENAPANQRLVISYTDKSIANPSVRFTAEQISGNGDQMLDAGELFLITIKASDLPRGVILPAIAANERWTLELQSPLGGSVEVSRTMPFVLQPVMRLP